MNAEEDYNVAARYKTVRKHLDSLGYKQALSFDALPLIEKLLADLIQTTDSLKHFKDVAQKNIEAYSQLQLSVDPYKCDNARLVRECNELHLNLIEAKENHQKQVKDLKKQIYKLEYECNDLQLASSRNLQKIKELEAESSKKSKKILELQGKCLKPIISNVALASKKRACYPLRRPVLESEPLPKTGVTPLPSLTNVEPKVVDLLSMANHKTNCLSHEVTKLRGELSIQTDNVHMLKNQLLTKEKEIVRLTKMLQGGRPYSAVCQDCICKKSEKSFAMTQNNMENNELRMLQQEKLALEQQLKEALNKQHDAMSQAVKLAERNEELEKELRDIDHIALAVEADCNSAVKENNRRVCRLQEKLEDVMTQVHVLEGELTVERREVQELRADLEACRLEKRNIQRTLESTLDEKKQMTDRINELTVIEKSLNNEIERLAKENDNQKQDIIQLQYTNKMLKEQMHAKDIVQGGDGDDMKRVKEKGEKNDHNKASKNHRDIYSSVPSDRREMERRDICKDGEVTRDDNSTGYSDLFKRLNEKESQIASLQQTIGQLRRERDYYKDEYDNVRDRYSKSTDKDNADLWTRIRELKCQLSEKENILDELQREKKEMARERANLESRLQICKNEHKTSYPICSVCKHIGPCACSSSPMSNRDIGVTKAMFERLEHERDVARADVDRLIEERDALRERLKMAAEAHTSEQQRFRENLTDLETRLKHIEKERQDLLLTQGTRRATINGLEDQLEDMREELRRTKQDLATQRTQYFQLRALQDQTDQALGDAQNQLTQSEAELNKVMDRNRALERQQIQLDNQVKELKQEIGTVRTSMTHLDNEKDQLLMVLDEKTERIAALEREIMSKEQQAMGMEQQMRDLQHKLEICVDQSADQERQLRSMQLDMENVQRQLETTTVDRENAIQENRRLQDDLAAVTCEVRNLQRELEASRAESFDLKRQLQSYVSEVRRAEELLNRKENERTEMLNHFRSLSLEATVLENNNHSLESEAAETRGALQSARDRLLDLERQLADRDCLIRGYETQISELTQNVASMETQLRQQGDQRHRAEADLTAVRDLCVKLDQQKDVLAQQLGDKDALRAEYDAQIARLKAEQNMIQDQMNRDRATVMRLETLLDQARQESINAQAANQELQNEMSRLKQKISELQSKLSAESAELRQYQNQAAEYSKQISELRRQVTNERFDRARKEEEQRRNSEVSSTIFVRQDTVHDPEQPPIPNTRLSHEWNGTSPIRYFQKEGKESPVSRTKEIGTNSANHSLPLSTRHLNDDNEPKYPANKDKILNNSRITEAPNDVHCINIILHSACATKLKRCECHEKEFGTNGSTVVPNHENMPRKGSLAPSTKALTFDAVQKKYDRDIFNTDAIRNGFTESTRINKEHEKPKRIRESIQSTYNDVEDLGFSHAPDLNDQSFGLNDKSEKKSSPVPSTKTLAFDTVPRERYHHDIFNTVARNDFTASTSISNEPEKIRHVRGNDHCNERKNFHVPQSQHTNGPPFHSNGTTVKKGSPVPSTKTLTFDTVPKTMFHHDIFNIDGVKQEFTPLTPLKHENERTRRGTQVSSVIPLYPTVTTGDRSKTIQISDDADTRKSAYLKNNETPTDKRIISSGKPQSTKAHANSTTIEPSYPMLHKYLSSKTNKTPEIKNIKDESVCSTKNCCTLSCNKNNRIDYSTYHDASAPSNNASPAGKTVIDVRSIDYSTLSSGKYPSGWNDETLRLGTLTSPKADNLSQVTPKNMNITRTQEEVKKSKDKVEPQHSLSDYQIKEKTKYRNKRPGCQKNGNEVNTSELDSNGRAQSEFTKPEFVKMLIDIKEHTKGLEEQLTIINKSMKNKKRVFCQENCKNVKQRKDEGTQQPDKKNMYIQEPNQEKIVSSKDTKLKVLKEFSNTKDPEDRNSLLKTPMKLKIHEDGIQVHKCCRRQNKSDENSFDLKNSVPPLAVSTPKKEGFHSLHDKQESHCKPSCCAHAENSQESQDIRMHSTKKQNHVNNSSNLIFDDRINNRCNECPVSEGKDHDVTLSKGSNNTCLKSNYRRSKFARCRQKFIIYSPVLVDQKLIRCTAYKRKLQALLKDALKSGKHETGEHSCCSEESRHTHEKIKTSDSIHNLSSNGTFVTAFTESSDLYITTATSMSFVTLQDEVDDTLEDLSRKRARKNELCTLS